MSFVGKPGDAHQTLLDILGLHPDSVEYYWRYAREPRPSSTTSSTSGASARSSGRRCSRSALQAAGGRAAAAARATRARSPGHPAARVPHRVRARSRTSSTTARSRRPSPIRAYTDDGRNYIQWLIDAASASLDDVVAERGFTGDVSPQALLYLYLRHALMLGYYDTSYRLHRTAGFLSATELAAMKPEPPFVHVDRRPAASESRYAALYKIEPRITASPRCSSATTSRPTSANLPRHGRPGRPDRRAARCSPARPTAQLERLFAEHIDICSYRLDAWLLGLVSLQLQEMRAQQGDHGDVPRGAHRRATSARTRGWRTCGPSPPRCAPVAAAARSPGDVRRPRARS